MDNPRDPFLTYLSASRNKSRTMRTTNKTANNLARIARRTDLLRIVSSFLPPPKKEFIAKHNLISIIKLIEEQKGPDEKLIIQGIANIQSLVNSEIVELLGDFKNCSVTANDKVTGYFLFNHARIAFKLNHGDNADKLMEICNMFREKSAGRRRSRGGRKFLTKSRF